MADVLDAHISEVDTFTMQLERDPLLRSTIVAVTMFDRVPSWDVLVDRIERATRLTPTFRQKLAPTPLRLAPPRWVIDPDFDLSFHLRRARVPSPGDMADVLEFARHAGMSAFDHDRPLWEFTLLDGLAGRRAALVMKVHHALTDGIGGIQLAAHVVDLQRRPATLGPLPEKPWSRPHGPLDTVTDAVLFDMRRVMSTGRDLARSMPGTLVHTLRDPRAATTDALATVKSVARFVKPVTRTLSPVMTERRLQWQYDTLDVPLDGLKAAAKSVGGTLNDGFIGGVTGGLRLYHEQHGAAVDTLRLTMPISIRSAADAPGGNKVTLVRFEVPVGIDDPAKRMVAIDELCEEVRHERAIPYSNAIAGVLNLLPIAVTGGMLKHVDFLASNVPGFGGEVFIGGALVEGFYAFGPTLGSAANVTLMSYRETCHVGITTDAGAVDDPDVFLACLRQGFEEVLALGGESAASSASQPARRRRPVSESSATRVVGTPVKPSAGASRSRRAAPS
ncbi:MAG: wax ester/triacylglycerol synthase domain-containing protein [Acidimicrobiales bacterium]